jgi:hypothetical protein
LLLVIHTGVRRIDGVPLTFPFVLTVLPLMMSIAAFAAAAASSRTDL